MTESQANELIAELGAVKHAVMGDGQDRPGIAHEIRDHKHTLYGTDEKMGLVQKVNFMWRIHVWFLCSMSAVAGYFFKGMADHFTFFK